MVVRKPMTIGPFIRGLNTFDDPTAIHDQECSEALNFDTNLDGSLRGRPPFTDLGRPLNVTGSAFAYLLGYFYEPDGNAALLAGDGVSTTWVYRNSAWSVVTSSFSAVDMVQFDGAAWLVSPPGASGNGGHWSPDSGFTAVSAMPRGRSIATYKSRLWIVSGQGSSTPARMYYSKVLGQPNFWDSPGFVDIGSGDGQVAVKLVQYFDSLLIFRTQSIWSFQYSIDPASAVQSVVVPNVGLQGVYALETYENYIYFMYDNKAFQFINNRVQQLNVKVPFVRDGSVDSPIRYTVSLFNNRVIFSYFGTMYVYSLRTRTWTTWKSSAWGPIGQLKSPYIDDNADVAFALPSPEQAPLSVVARNRAPNPTGQVSNEYWQPLPGASSVVRVTSAPGAPFALRVSKSSDSWGGARLRDVNLNQTLGIEDRTIRVRMLVRLVNPSATSQARAGLSFGGYIPGVNNPGNTGDPVAVDGSSWTEVTHEFTAALSSGILAIAVQVEDNEDFYVRQVYADNQVLESTYFDGNTADGGGFVYRWTGASGLSPSEKLVSGALPLLRISDEVSSGQEEMQCILQTKNYSFEVPGSYKVLFWWGLDAIFKTNVRGQAVPGVFSSGATWGRFFLTNETWGSLLSGTWAYPLADNPSVISDVATPPGPVRKFVKFFKKLRFRQLYFRVVFNTDGSSATAPVQVFTISAYLAEKETVNKTVT